MDLYSIRIFGKQKMINRLQSVNVQNYIINEVQLKEEFEMHRFPSCREYPEQSCYNCLWNCHEQDIESQMETGHPCDDWEPSTGGHPSTPNPCRANYFDPNLCWEHCWECEHAQEARENTERIERKREEFRRRMEA